MQTRYGQGLWADVPAVDTRRCAARCRRESRRMTPRPHRRPSRAPAREPLPDEPIASSAAIALGWTPSALRHASAVGDLQRLGRAVLATPLAPDESVPARRVSEQVLLRAAQASALRCPRAAISHFAAGIAVGIPTFGPLNRPCLTVPAGTRLRHLADAHLHRAALLPGEVIDVGGYRFTGTARTVMDIAREHGVEAGVVAADHALHEGLISRDDLAAAFEMCGGWPGRRNARITLLCADDAAESPLESVSRLRIVRAGLPAPRPQAEICDLHGNYITRCDFLWDDLGVVGEADGRMKYREDNGHALRERSVREALERTGLIVVSWGWSDLFAFDAVISRLRLGFARGARTGSPERRWGVFVPR